jgi:glycosyltransferase involved in cell wall biosynthesis
VIATRESPLPELLDGGGLFIAPGSKEELEAGMRRLLEDGALRNALGARARERALALTWETCARHALDAITEAAA